MQHKQQRHACLIFLITRNVCKYSFIHTGWESKKKGQENASTCIASKVVDKEPKGLSRPWTTACNRELKRETRTDSLNCWMDMHHTPKLQTVCIHYKKSIKYLQTISRNSRRLLHLTTRVITFIFVVVMSLTSDSKTKLAPSTLKQWK